MRESFLSCIVAISLAVPLAPRPRVQASPQCLKYAPDTVAIAGNLNRLVFPGRPNYESVAQGDEEESGFYLFLHHPVCTVGDSLSPTAYPMARVDTVQLVLDADGYTRLRPFLHKDVTVRGRLLAAHTAHHHAPLLLLVLSDP